MFSTFNFKNNTNLCCIIWCVFNFSHWLSWLKGKQFLDLQLGWLQNRRFSSLYPFLVVAAATAKSLQSCQALCDPIDGSPPGSPVPGILQGITLEWVVISFSNAWKWKVKVKSLSRVWLLAAPWTAAYQAHPSMGFSRQEYWSGVPLPSPFYMSSLSYTIVYLCMSTYILPCQI